MHEAIGGGGLLVRRPEAATVEFRVLGPLEVCEAGQLIEVRPAKLRALLAILVLHANQPIPAERLIEHLWGETPPATAPNTLQGYVSQLRRLLEPDRKGRGRQVIQTRSAGYVLTVEPDCVDASRFERLASEGRKALVASQAAEATSLFGEALALWRGPALVDFAYEQFAQEAITRLEELRLDAVDDWIDGELALGRHVEVLGQLKAFTAAAPLRERRWGQLMRALYRAGRQADALRAYQDLRRLLADELGIEPSLELKRLEAAVLAQDPALEWQGPAPGPPVSADEPAISCTCEHPVSLPRGLNDAGVLPLVGRLPELSQLRTEWEEAGGGSHQAVLLRGEPGIGKTRLAAELAGQAHADGAIVLFGRCDEDMGVPYQPFVEALRQFVDAGCPRHLTDHLGRWPGELVRLVPEIDSRTSGLAQPLSADAETERYRLFDAVSSWLAAASSRAPVLLVLDDLHWATKPTLLLLRHVLRGADPMRLLVVATYRDSELDRSHPLTELVADLTRERRARQLSLEGLDEAGVGELVAAAVGDRHGVPRTWAAPIHADTKGNPFFVAELARHLLESGFLEQARQPRSQLELGIPEGVRAVVTRRLARLSDATVAALSTAAVAGLEFDLPVVEIATGLDEDVVTSALEEAVSRGLAEEAAGIGIRYRFSHGLVRTALYARMGRARRALTHRRVGEAIEQVHRGGLEDRLAELALHFAEAARRRPDARAAGYAGLAGDRALAQLAYEEAVGHYRRGLSLLDAHAQDGAEARQFCSTLVSLGEAERLAGDAAYRQTLITGARRAQQLGDSGLLAKAVLANDRGQFSVAGEVDDERVELLRSALEAYPPEDSGVRASLLAHLAAELVASGDWVARVALSDEAVDMARRLGDPETLVIVLNLRFVTVWAASTLHERLAITAEARDLAARLPNPTLGFYANYFASIAAMEAGDAATADGLLRFVHELAESLNQPILKWYDRVGHAKRALIAGRLHDSEALAFEALAFGQATGQPDAVRRFGALLFAIRLHQGRLGELLATAESGFVPPSAVGSLQMLSQCGLAMVYCDLDRREDARRVFDAVLAQDFRDLPNDYGSLPTVALAASVCSYLKDARRADLLYGLLEPYREQFVDLGPTWFGSTAHHMALLAAVAGDPMQADRDFSYAAAAHARVGSGVWLARTELEWGLFLLGGNDPRGRRRGEDLVKQARRRSLQIGLGEITRRAAQVSDTATV